MTDATAAMAADRLAARRCEAAAARMAARAAEARPSRRRWRWARLGVLVSPLPCPPPTG